LNEPFLTVVENLTNSDVAHAFSTVLEAAELATLIEAESVISRVTADAAEALAVLPCESVPSAPTLKVIDPIVVLISGCAVILTFIGLLEVTSPKLENLTEVAPAVVCLYTVSEYGSPFT